MNTQGSRRYVPLTSEKATLSSTYTSFETSPTDHTLTSEEFKKLMVCPAIYISFPTRDTAPFLYQLLETDLEAEDSSIIPAAPRPQFNIDQDKIRAEKTSIRSRQFQRHQVITHLGEHALNQPLMQTRYQVIENRLISPFQRDQQPFTRSCLETVIRENEAYLHSRFGKLPNQAEIEWLDQHLELVVEKIFTPAFFLTRQGLELAELLGLRRLEHLISSPDLENQTIVLASPYSPLRGTINEYHMTMFGTVRTSFGQQILDLTIARNSMPFASYQEQLGQIDTIFKQFTTPHDFVSNPVISSKTKTELLSTLGAVTDPEIIHLFHQTIWECRHHIAAFIHVLNSNAASTEKNEQLHRLEQIVIAKHQALIRSYQLTHQATEEVYNLINWIQDGYGRGGSCGFIASFAVEGGLQDRYGSLQFECPHCHALITRPFGQLIKHCSVCGNSVRC